MFELFSNRASEAAVYILQRLNAKGIARISHHRPRTVKYAVQHIFSKFVLTLEPGLDNGAEINVLDVSFLSDYLNRSR